MRYSAEELEAMPTLAQGQADDLKVDTGTKRVWLCRCGRADGMPYDNQVTVEKLTDDGRWVSVYKYKG
jgi:CDGSH-type Zn-finger protein